MAAAVSSAPADTYRAALRDFEALDDGGWINAAERAHQLAFGRTLQVFGPDLEPELHVITSPGQLAEPSLGGPVTIRWCDPFGSAGAAVFASTASGLWRRVDEEGHAELPWTEVADAPFVSTGGWHPGHAVELLITCFAARRA